VLAQVASVPVAQAQVAGYIVPMSLREAREESPINVVIHTKKQKGIKDPGREALIN
jgi:hypothetical protein